MINQRSDLLSRINKRILTENLGCVIGNYLFEKEMILFLDNSYK